MIVFILFLATNLDSDIDSLEHAVLSNPKLKTILELNKCYLVRGDYSKGFELLRIGEKHVSPDKQPVIILKNADNFLFAGRILDARKEYQRLVGKFPHSPLANDGLERLHFIESTRNDTVLMKKLTYAMCLLSTDQYESAEDSLKNLLRSKHGAYAFFYLSQLYLKKNDLPQALSALMELNKTYPAHAIHEAHITQASINLELQNDKAARSILEKLVLKEPNSIYAVRARRLLRTINVKENAE